ncbi:MAG TPA: methylated-DNA--[protein]-cysteine S-methyltransferase [Candidatus Sulfotelmatobacter sp.]|nr:methylated-DNA--[protein]-cysteine S-methyltransferase [Candidatus Sulfotelmatobacter sp.]
MLRLLRDRLASPIGEIQLLTDADGVLRALDFTDHVARMEHLLRLQNGPYAIADGAAPPAIARALTAYFAGEIGALDALPVATGGTDFQRAVWAALRDIPVGTTTTYGALAKRLASPTAGRAVGAANGANPIGIVVPCHRVIGANGTLTGYGGGIFRKRWLLEHEAGALGLISAADRGGACE